MCATLFLFTTSFVVCTEIVALSELKSPLLCNKFHCFHNGQVLASFSLSLHSMLQTGQWSAFFGHFSERVIHELTSAGFNILNYCVEEAGANFHFRGPRLFSMGTLLKVYDD